MKKSVKVMCVCQKCGDNHYIGKLPNVGLRTPDNHFSTHGRAGESVPSKKVAEKGNSKRNRGIPQHNCICGFCGKKMVDLQATNKRYRKILEDLYIDTLPNGDMADKAVNIFISTALKEEDGK